MKLICCLWIPLNSHATLLKDDDSDNNDNVQARFASSEESSACSSVLSSLESVESNTSEGESNTSEGGNNTSEGVNGCLNQLIISVVTLTHQQKTLSGWDCLVKQCD